MLNQVSIITNLYGGILSRLVERPVARVEGCFEEKEFERETAPLFRQQYMDVVIFDATAVKEKFLEAARYLKMNLPANVRLIVLYPNLMDEAVYQQLLVYGIYDIVRPIVDKDRMSDHEIENKIIAEMNWAISEPVPFSKVVDDLAISVITHHISAPEVPEKPKEKKINKPRLIGFYGETDEAFTKLRESGRYNVIGIWANGSDMVESIDLSAIDLIVMDSPDADSASYIKSLVDVNENKATVMAGYVEDEDAEASAIKGIRCFIYDGTAEHFARQVSVTYGKKEEDTVPASHKVYAFYGVKGGVGTTTLASLMAMDYARKHPEEKVAIIDFSAQAGDLGERFGIFKPDPNLFECVATFTRAKRDHLDIDLLKDKIPEYCHYIKEKRLYVLPTAHTDIYRYTNFLYRTQDIAEIYRYVLETFREKFDMTFVDVTDFGGFPYEMAITSSDQIFLVGDGKLSSTGHMLTKIDEITEAGLSARMWVILNRTDTVHQETEYENVKIIRSHIKEPKVIELPVDRRLRDDEKELSIVCSTRYADKLDEIWYKAAGIPLKKRGLPWKR